MAKTNNKQRKAAVRSKSTAKRKQPGKSSPSPREKEVEKARAIPLDFSTARSMEPGDRRINKSSRIVSFLVKNAEGEEVVYYCSVDEVPIEASIRLMAGE